MYKTDGGERVDLEVDEMNYLENTIIMMTMTILRCNGNVDVRHRLHDMDRAHTGLCYIEVLKRGVI